MESILPEALYAEVAPLPVPMAQHLYSTFLKSLAHPLDDPSCFLETFQEKRRSVYAYTDSLVRNRDGQLPHHLRYTTQWLRENLGQYIPDKQPIPPKTFNHWVKNGFIRNTRKGQPTPDSGVAVYILRRMPQAISRIVFQSLGLSSFPCRNVVVDTPWARTAWDPHRRLLSNIEHCDNWCSLIGHLSEFCILQSQSLTQTGLHLKHGNYFHWCISFTTKSRV